MRHLAFVLSLLASTVVHAAPPPPPPPPPPPATPQNIPPLALEGQRLAGEKNIVPDDVTKTEIQRSGKDKVVASFKLCISDAGTVTSVSVLKSSGFSAYDTKITTEMRRWKYRPYIVNGNAVPVCTAVTFIYAQSADELPTIAPPVLAKLRTSGKLDITLDRFTQAELRAAGHAHFVGTRTVCFTESGQFVVSAADHRTAYWRFEAAIDALAKGWAFKPYLVGGKPTRACGTLGVRYDVPRDAPAMIDGGVMHTLLGGKSLGPQQASGPAPKGGDPWERGKDVMALVCIDAAGVVTQAELASQIVAAEGKRDGLPDPADEALVREIRAWRARPHVVNGKAQPACALVKLPFGS